MRVLNVERIPRVPRYRCVVCCEAFATARVTLGDDEAVVKLVVCGGCAKLTGDELVEGRDER